jgi:multidrug resistance efflux pump
VTSRASRAGRGANQMTGVVSWVLMVAEQKVEVGEQLFEIDAAQFEIDVSAAQAALDEALARLRLRKSGSDAMSL